MKSIFTNHLSASGSKDTTGSLDDELKKLEDDKNIQVFGSRKDPNSSKTKPIKAREGRKLDSIKKKKSIKMSRKINRSKK